MTKEACENSFCEKEASGLKRKRSSEASTCSFNANENKDGHKRKKKARKSSEIRREAQTVIEALRVRQLHENVVFDLEGVDVSSVASDDSDQEINVTEDPNPPVPQVSSVTTIIQEKNKEIDGLRKQLQREKVKVFNFQKERLSENSELQEFGGGLKIPKSLVDIIRDRYTGSPSQFLRAMMEQTGLFTLEEIVEHSTYYRKSSTAPETIRPILPPKFITLKEFVILECGILRGSATFIKYQASVRGICSDPRKRLKQLKTGSDNSPNS